MTLSDAPVICFSHLRWDLVHQRPQHLMSRAARTRDVYFVEEPVTTDASPVLATMRTERGVTIVVPHLPAWLDDAQRDEAQRRLLDGLVAGLAAPPVLWYCTPMAIAWSRHLAATAIAYDCMDELSLFAGAPRELGEREAELVRKADVVFTRGESLHRLKRARYPRANLHSFPSAVDTAHFGQARCHLLEPAEQATLPRPRAGYFGVIDERMDLALLDELAARRPELHLVMIGPILKIDPTSLPRRSNLHWLGARRYDALPSYLAGWDIALLPFARCDATRYIAPTKIGEYLAAGKPVVSTSIPDVVETWGKSGLAAIADTAAEVSAAIDRALAADAVAHRTQADAVLRGLSWDRTWAAMWAHVEDAAARRSGPLDGDAPPYRRAAG